MSKPTDKPAEMTAATSAEFAALRNENATLAGRIAALEASIAQRDTASKRDAAISAAKAKLSAHRRTLPADFDTTAAKFFDAGTLDAFVAAIIGTREEPPATFGAAFADTGSTPADVPEVMEFAAQGPEKLAAARDAHRMYEETRKRMPGFNVPLKTYLQTATTSPARA